MAETPEQRRLGLTGGVGAAAGIRLPTSLWFRARVAAFTGAEAPVLVRAIRRASGDAGVPLAA